MPLLDQLIENKDYSENIVNCVNFVRSVFDGYNIKELRIDYIIPGSTETVKYQGDELKQYNIYFSSNYGPDSYVESKIEYIKDYDENGKINVIGNKTNIGNYEMRQFVSDLLKLKENNTKAHTNQRKK